MFELRYVEDESVQSWIFRNLVVDGEIDFSSILSSEGDWYNNVSFRKNCPERMTRTRDVELLRFLRNSGLALKYAGKYDNPVDYLVPFPFSFEWLVHHKLGEVCSGLCLHQTTIRWMLFLHCA